MLQLDRLNKREKVIEQKLVKLKSFNKMEPMIAALKSMKKNARYKSTRTQAERALDELDFYTPLLPPLYSHSLHFPEKRKNIILNLTSIR